VVRLNVRGSPEGVPTARLILRITVPQDWPAGEAVLRVTAEPDDALLAQLRVSRLTAQSTVRVDA